MSHTNISLIQVQLQFSAKQMHSASNVSLVIEAAANSFCAVRAVDQSVLLLKSETELSAETVSCPNKHIVLFFFLLHFSVSPLEIVRPC